MTLRVAIHQPEYFPWLGLLAKARRADVFVLLDSVQFDRTSLQHRTKLWGANGAIWMTIPFVHRFPQRIDEVEFADPRWSSKHWKTVQACYGRAPGFKVAAPSLEAFFGATFARVADAAAESMRILFDAFGVRTRVLKATGLQADGEKSDLVLAICRELGATEYLSGRTGATYLDAESFAAAGIGITVQTFAPPAYPRHRPLSEEDQRGLSALDAWLNTGVEAPALLATPEASP